MSTLPTIPTSDISGTTPLTPFAVKRIICIARNYADHAREMGHEPNKEPPFYFFKPLTALDLSSHFHLPNYSSNVHFEMELVIAIGHGGRHLNSEQAGQCIKGFGLGLDMTCRDIQQAAQEAGRPWDNAKGFDGSARCSTLVAGDISLLKAFGSMSLNQHKTQNETPTLVQQGHWQDMIWPPTELLCHISLYTKLVEGDLIYTGTPAGVGPVSTGDHLIASMEGFPHQLHTQVVADNTVGDTTTGEASE